MEIIGDPGTEDDPSSQTRDQGRANGKPGGHRLVGAGDQDDQGRREKGDCQCDPGNGADVHGGKYQNFSVSRSSTWVVWRAR